MCVGCHTLSVPAVLFLHCFSDKSCVDAAVVPVWPFWLSSGGCKRVRRVLKECPKKACKRTPRLHTSTRPRNASLKPVSRLQRMCFWGGLSPKRPLRNLIEGWIHDVPSSRPCRSRQPPRRIGMGHLSRWWYVCISLLLLHCGEAKTKEWSMGTFNPSGLGGKHQVISSYLNAIAIFGL